MVVGFWGLTGRCALRGSTGNSGQLSYLHDFIGNKIIKHRHHQFDPDKGGSMLQLGELAE